MPLSETTSIANLHVPEKGIICITFSQDGELDETCAIEILSAIHRLSEGNAHALLYDFNHKWVQFSNISKKLASSRNAEDSGLKGRAFLASTLQQEIEAGHFIHYAKPLCETRIFHDRTEAMNWLRSTL